MLARPVDALKLVPGLSDFDPSLEVSHCDKPGAGSVDAPRAFHVKLAEILQDEYLKAYFSQVVKYGAKT